MHARELHIPAVFLAVFAAILSIYLSCAAPSVMYGDSAELQAVALKGGIAHPTGYPTFILLGRLFGAILGGDQAHRITAMSSFFGAAAACAFIAVLLKLGLPLGIAISGALIYALSFTFFWSSIRTEVYTLGVFLFLVSLWLTLHAVEKPTGARTALAGAGMGLVLTGHLTFAPPILVMVFALLLSTPAGGTSRPKRAAALAAAFVAGLLPYLYLVWIDRGGHPMNYLDYSIETSGGQYGLAERTFDDPWERIPWLLFGNQSRPTFFFAHPRPMLWQMLRALSIEFVYHFGPVALPIALIGIRRMLRIPRTVAATLFGIIVSSFLFGAGLGSGRMLPIFIIPSTIGCAILVSFGLLSVSERIARGESRAADGAARGGHGERWLGRLAILALVCGIVVVPHLARVGLQDSRSFPEDLKLRVEGEPPIDSVIPSLRHFWEPRRYGVRVLDIAPANALVVGKWAEIMVLYYLHFVEGMRPDITLEPYYYAHYVRLNRWQEEHDLSTQPIVFLRHPSELRVDIAEVDSLSVASGRHIYVRSAPFDPLPPPPRP